MGSGSATDAVGSAGRGAGTATLDSLIGGRSVGSAAVVRSASVVGSAPVSSPGGAGATASEDTVGALVGGRCLASSPEPGAWP
ncbi:MAG: hypothetical protein EKK42_33775 [Pseudonocardiaceae bacterium]|nr:MAG: hypothetical protein EKK42_33775 [Pseudonocardiaceae bacterium]